MWAAAHAASLPIFGGEIKIQDQAISPQRSGRSLAMLGLLVFRVHLFVVVRFLPLLFLRRLLLFIK